MNILYTDSIDFNKAFEAVLNRGAMDLDAISNTVSCILNNIKNNGLSEIFNQIKLFDNWNPNNIEDIKIPFHLMEDSYNNLPKNIRESLNIAYDRIYSFHCKQKQKSWFDYDEYGSMLGVKITPFKRAGIYVPGGKAIYPSSLLMNAIPAIVAGVEDIVVCSPTLNNKISPILLAVAYMCNIKEMYKVGGIGAIGLMSYGVNNINKVDTITGPGNIFVACAKKLVFGDVNIDMIAGPSEITIIADDNANPRYIAIDLLAQAEHDEFASSILLTHSMDLALRVNEILSQELKELKRVSIASKSIKDRGYIIVTKDINESIYLANYISSEHLEVLIDNPYQVLPYINNAGAIFLGEYSPEVMGDYLAGPNHTLPTGGSAKFFSSLSVDNFIKKSTIIHLSKDMISNLGKHCINLANIEGLEAHSKSIQFRLKDING